MKNIYLLLIVGICSAGMSLQCVAAPRAATSAGENYLVTERDLSGWSIGLFGNSRERDVTLDKTLSTTTLDETRVLGYVGYRLFSWVSVYLYGGQTDATLARQNSTGTVTGGALEFNLLSQLLMDPGLEEDHFRVHSTVSYTSSEAESGLATWEFNEVEANLTFSIVNELSGKKPFLPQAI
ncbi:MAG: hypothetical protein O3C57_05860, partial [Verrucomicrobia bacterium]|nr:hypothetical protein [Verrucomicrobiota bacterium]